MKVEAVLREIFEVVNTRAPPHHVPVINLHFIYLFFSSQMA